ncbi:MAG TPA: hypothetical protein VM344_05795 [Vitreimonas sp.]|nr:hypothetical protein [Vitreimonas sp.]
MIDRRRPTPRPTVRRLALPVEDLTPVMVRFTASTVTLVVAVLLTVAT